MGRNAPPRPLAPSLPQQIDTPARTAGQPAPLLLRTIRFLRAIAPKTRTPQKLRHSGEFLEEAGGGNRTRINSLEGYSFTTKLRPQKRLDLRNRASIQGHLLLRL
jgi:hypothetical protein